MDAKRKSLCGRWSRGGPARRGAADFDFGRLGRAAGAPPATTTPAPSWASRRTAARARPSSSRRPTRFTRSAPPPASRPVCARPPRRHGRLSLGRALTPARGQVTEGSIEFAVNKVDSATGEFSGVFVSEQVPTPPDPPRPAPPHVALAAFVVECHLAPHPAHRVLNHLLSPIQFLTVAVRARRRSSRTPTWAPRPPRRWVWARPVTLSCRAHYVPNSSIQILQSILSLWSRADR